MTNNQMAICPYCGQMYSSKLNAEETNEDLLHKEAVMQCNCPEARQQAAKWELIDDTKNQLKLFFKNENPDCVLDAEVVDSIRSLTEKFIHYLADGTLNSVSVDVEGIGKVTLANKNSKISIKKQTTAEIIRRY